MLSVCNIPGTVLSIWIRKGEVFKDFQSVGLTFLSLKTRAISLWFWHLPPPPPLPSPHEIYNVILYSLIFSSWNHSWSFTNYVHNIRLSIPILRSFFCPNGSHRKSAEAGNIPRRSTFSYSIKLKSEYFCICSTLQYKRAHSCETQSLFYSTDLIFHWKLKNEGFLLTTKYKYWNFKIII